MVGLRKRNFQRRTQGRWKGNGKELGSMGGGRATKEEERGRFN